MIRAIQLGREKNQWTIWFFDVELSNLKSMTIDQTEEKGDLDLGMISGGNDNMGEKSRMFVELETWGQ